MATEPQNNNTDQTPTLPYSHPIPTADTNSGHDPPTLTKVAGDDPNKEDPDATREPKRRKSCPAALDNLEELGPASNPSFSFSFDTNSGGSAPEVTPKFGSFNLTIPVVEEKDCDRWNLECKVNEEHEDQDREQEQEQDEEEEEESVGVIGDSLKVSVDGTEGVE